MRRNETEKRHVNAYLLSLVGKPEGLISAYRFYANREASWGYEPSFDGTLLAWWGTKGKRPAVFVGEATATVPRVIASFSGTIVHFSWRGYVNRLLLTDQNRLFEVDPRHPGTRVDVTPKNFQTWQIIAEPKRPGDSQAVISHDRSPAFSDLFETLDDGSSKRILEENSGRTESWLLDADRRPCLRVERGEDGLRHYLTRHSHQDGSETWKEIARLSPSQTLVVWNGDLQGGQYEALSNRSRDTIALVRIDPATGRERVVAGSDDVDVLDAIRFNPGEPADLAVVRNGYPTLLPISDGGRTFARLLGEVGKHTDFEVSGASRDGRIVAASVSVEAQQPRPMLFDLAAGRSMVLGRTPKVLPPARTRPVAISARDGEGLSAILTLPEDALLPLPAVVVAHGGPARHVSWGFNRDHAFLASRGYAVLCVNYRGSTGFGKRFQSLGFREFGRAIQDDIADAAYWLIENGTAASGRIAIQGESFGGTIAALALCRDPGLFAAAIADNAVLDLLFQMQNNPAGWGLFTDQVEQYFGSPECEADATALREYSPINQVSRAHGSVLLTASLSDPVVSVEQTKRYEAALREAGLPVTARYFSGEGHGYAKWQTRLARARAVEFFLARTIGGKAKNFDWRTRLATYWN